jgi:hypothetical protein
MRYSFIYGNPKRERGPAQMLVLAHASGCDDNHTNNLKEIAMTGIFSLLAQASDTAPDLTETAQQSTNAIVHSFNSVAQQFIVFGPKLVAAVAVIVIG